ncbi:MAG: DUF1292 domain-containing protein [Oscillospiraceae bacterium]|jgi:uncharacterized protein YrzB (UPF0473 family)|nr:DUF1292 domain-containing protein [Oscillospiraceae bacterium]
MADTKDEEKFGDDFYTITDDDGNEFALEHLDTIEIGDDTYMAFTPADMDEDDPDFGMVILKVVEENGEELFATIDDDDEKDAVHAAFMEQLFADDEES